VRGSGIRPDGCDKAAILALRVRDKKFARHSGERARVSVSYWCVHVTGSVNGENGGTLGSARSVSKGIVAPHGQSELDPANETGG
jgi:hypothetical protein